MVCGEDLHVDVTQIWVKHLWKNCFSLAPIFFSYKLSKVPSFLMWNSIKQLASQNNQYRVSTANSSSLKPTSQPGGWSWGVVGSLGGWKVLGRPSCLQFLSESSFRVDTFLWNIPGTYIPERDRDPLVQRMHHRHPQALPGDWRMGPRAALAICFPVLLSFQSPLFQTSWLLIRSQTSPGFSNQAVHPPGEPCLPPTPSVSRTSAGSIPHIFQSFH